LVGKAGSSHWSAAIEADREVGVLRFDIACRLGDEPTFLGSSYSRADEPKESALPQPRIDLAMINDGCRRAVEPDEDRLSIRVFSDLNGLPRTIRWKYLASPHCQES
jgi:hypothetical protein